MEQEEVLEGQEETLPIDSYLIILGTLASFLIFY